MTLRLGIVLPTYNERGNLRGMFLISNLEKISAEMIDYGQKVT